MFNKWLERRESGAFPRIGDGDFIMKRIYSSLEPYTAWNDVPLSQCPTQYGAVFNLEFSPEGNILAAACEKKAILLFDSLTQKQTQRILNAHTDNVNCIKFLDNRTFATCSDDTTVAIWDVRFLSKRLRSLQGHSNWVKNIEYSNKEGLLVTSGFDGSIFTWDINSHTEEGLIYQKVFNTSGLMRCRISPDCTKLVLSTTGGYLMIIHDLDLNNLHKDICGFRPSIYRLMQMGNQYIPQAAKYDYIFSKKQTRNRVELVTDFPDGNDAEIILALQIHPNGQSFLSRNISYGEQTEWSCIHDIDEEQYDITARRPDKRKRKLNDEGDENNLPSTSNGRRENPRTDRRNRPTPGESSDESSEVVRPIAPTFTRLITYNGRRANRPTLNNAVQALSASMIRVTTDRSPTGNGRTTSIGVTNTRGPSTSNEASSSGSNSTSNGSPRSGASSRSDFVPDIWAAEITVQERAARQARGRQTNSVTGYDFVYAISSGILPMSNANSTEPRAAAANEPSSVASNPVPPDDPSTSHNDRFILQNAKKLMFYIEESNKGKGFIKEPSFSADGRIICSPYDTGVRLLAYSEECSEHPRTAEKECLKREPKQLVEIKTIKSHSDIVLSTSFSPTQPLLVTGCKLGKVTWHFPNL